MNNIARYSLRLLFESFFRYLDLCLENRNITHCKLIRHNSSIILSRVVNLLISFVLQQFLLEPALTAKKENNIKMTEHHTFTVIIIDLTTIIIILQVVSGSH